MAEIRVEPKSKTPIWPWIIGILILLGLIWLLMDAFGEDEPELEEAPIEEVGSLTVDSPQQLALTIYQAPLIPETRESAA